MFGGWIISVLLDFTFIEKVVYFTCIPIGALLPDIDRVDTKLGHLIKPLSGWLNKTVGHRTLTHSLFFITVLYYSAIIAFGINIVFTGLMIGCVMHVLFDMMTPAGVSLLYPLSSKRFKIN